MAAFEALRREAYEHVQVLYRGHFGGEAFARGAGDDRATWRLADWCAAGHPSASVAAGCLPRARSARHRPADGLGVSRPAGARRDS